MRRFADRLSYRNLALLGIATFALAGAATAYAVPLALHPDSWIAQEDVAPTALFLGLLLSFTGATVVRVFATPPDRSPR